MSNYKDDSNPRHYPNNPSSSSSSITLSDLMDAGIFAPVTERASSSRFGSASSSFQNEAGYLNESGSGFSEVEFGPEFRLNYPLVGSVEFSERHVFLCYKNPSVWPSRIEAAEFDRLPRFLSAAVLARKSDMKKETCLTICEGHDGTETSNGDILIFPDMIRYRRLTHFDVDTFVEEVLVKEGEWLPGTPEKLNGCYVFVCCQGSRDRRCGVCGPALVSRFKEEIEVRGLHGKVSVRPCSHIGGHKSAGDIIIYRSNGNRDVAGHWYGYVMPNDVPLLLDKHVQEGEIVDLLWSGQMGLTEEQFNSEEPRLQENGEKDVQKNIRESTERQIDEATTATNGSTIEVNGSHQQNADTSCCRDTLSERADLPTIDMAKKVAVAPNRKRIGQTLLARINCGKSLSTKKVTAVHSWHENWEREDTYAALAVVCAAVSVAFAYRCYKQLE